MQFQLFAALKLSQAATELCSCLFGSLIFFHIHFRKDNQDVCSWSCDHMQVEIVANEQGGMNKKQTKQPVMCVTLIFCIWVPAIPNCNMIHSNHANLSQSLPHIERDQFFTEGQIKKKKIMLPDQ